MAESQHRTLYVGPITFNAHKSDPDNPYVQKRSVSFFTAARDDGSYSSLSGFVTEDDIIITPNYFTRPSDGEDTQKTPTPYHITNILFTLTPAELQDLGITKDYELNGLREFIENVEKNCPHAVADMKRGDFHLYKQTREDAFRTELMKKKYPNGVIVLDKPITS